MASTHNDDQGDKQKAADLSQNRGGKREKWPPPSTAQLRVRTMYKLREKISNGERPEVSEIKMLLGAILEKDLRNEENLLTYASVMGRKDWFKCIANEIREQFGKQALVKELRELDINGAHILSRAVSSQSDEPCFQEVYYELKGVLGMGGVTEQLEADDHMGRNIMMHAARGNDVGVFTQVYDLYEKKVKPGRWDLNGLPEEQWKERVKKTDRTGRTMLHHAAESGSLAIVKEVIEIAKYTGVYKEMTHGDDNGRTPLMFVLRDSVGDDRGRVNQKAKFHELWTKMEVKKDRMEPREINTIEVGGGEHPVKARIELFHAVRGGLASLNLFLEYFQKSRGVSKDIDIKVAEALGLEYIAHSSTSPPDQELLHQHGNVMLLAAAARGGHKDVMEKVVSAINVGHFRHPAGETNPADETGPIKGQNIEKAVVAIKENGSSLFTLAVMSGNPEAATYAYEIIHENFGEVWDQMSGPPEANSPLTHAVLCENGETMFNNVINILKKAAEKEQQQNEPESLLKAHFMPGKGTSAGSDQSSEETDHEKNMKVTPLAAAAFRADWKLFEKVYFEYEEIAGTRWSREEILDQVPVAPPKTLQAERTREMHEAKKHVARDFSVDSEKVSAVMWRDIMEAYYRATTGRQNKERTGIPSQTTSSNGEQTKTPFLSWRGKFISYSEQAVETAINGRFFEDLRELVKEGFPLHDMVIPRLLENIEDHEEDIIEIVTFAVGNASNPFAMGASVSKSVRTAETESPMHRNGLERLRRALDEFMCKLLDELPHTVRGMGMTLLRPMIPEGRLPLREQGWRDILANLIGFIVVEWMLEPSFLLKQDEQTISKRYIQDAKGPAFVGPLRRAVDRGSEALEFLSKPLILDFLHVKFICTLPHFAAKSVVQSTINEGFYKYGEGDKYDFEVFWPTFSKNDKPTKKDYKWDTLLLCFLQGCKPPAHEQASPTRQAEQGSESGKFPHITIMPGLQFLLAGIIGKPETFYKVPAVLFMFELFSYLTMLGLFCWVVRLENRDYIPAKECVFYVFVAGLTWREILEFLDGVSLWRYDQHGGKHSKLPGGKGMNRMVSACTRYILYDTWNFLDVMSIIFVVVAFVFRVRGIRDSGASAATSDDFFLAQFFLAASTPFFFARLLLLSQVDETLGPMIQIIGKLLAHTAHFAVFIIVVMTSFGLAFYSLFFGCEEGSALEMHFGEFHRALLTVFGAALGEFGTIIDDFSYIEDQCEGLAPELAYHASICLLVAYLVVMAVVLLNLLIAVLSTAHQEVYAKRRQQFFLARARLILQNAQAVAHRRTPVPFNLLQAALGILLDLFNEIIRFFKKSEFTPFTSGPAWPIIEGCLQRVAFALTFGLFAVALSTLLWAVSLPWIAWSLVHWVRDSKKNKQEQGRDNPHKYHRGHLRTLLVIILSGVVSIPALIAAALLGAACSIGSIILWFRGMRGVCEWVRWEMNGKAKHKDKAKEDNGGLLNCPTPMPGQERQNHWGKAWCLAKARNYRIQDDTESVHFHVASLLKSTTGLSMGDLIPPGKKSTYVPPAVGKTTKTR